MSYRSPTKLRETKKLTTFSSDLIMTPSLSSPAEPLPSVPPRLWSSDHQTDVVSPLTIRKMNSTAKGSSFTKRLPNSSSMHHRRSSPGQQQHSNNMTRSQSLPFQTSHFQNRRHAEETKMENDRHDQLVTTTQTMLERVLYQVVEIVMDAATSNRPLDVDRLQQLLHLPDVVKNNNDKEPLLLLTHKELYQIVTRVVIAAKESVRNNTKKPTGIHLSNLGSKRAVVSLSWARVGTVPRHSTTVKQTNEQQRGEQPKDFMFERVSI